MDELKNSENFKIPENYFEGFENRLKEKISQDIGLPGDSGFSAPEGYFENFEDRLLQKLDTSTTKVIKLRPYQRYWYTAVAVAAVLVFAFYINIGSEKELSFEDLAHTEIENYFESNEIGLSSYEIADVIPIEQIEINDMVEFQLTEDLMVDYFDDNIEDIDVLTTEYEE